MEEPSSHKSRHGLAPLQFEEHHEYVQEHPDHDIPSQGVSDCGAAGQTGNDDLKALEEIIRSMNKFSWQKSGGTYDPKFIRSSQSCILCSRGAVCLGVSCLGNTQVRQKQTRVLPALAGSCPGFEGGASLTSLIELRLGDSNSKKDAAQINLHFGRLFGWFKVKNEVLI